MRRKVLRAPLDARNQNRTMFNMAKSQVSALDAHRAESETTRKMTREQVEAWRAGWQYVNECHIREIRRMPRRVRLQQTNLLFQTARSMKLRHSLADPELKALRERWAKAKRRYEKNSKRA